MCSFGLILWIIVSMLESFHAQTVLIVSPSEDVLVDQVVTFTCNFDQQPSAVSFNRSGNVQICAFTEPYWPYACGNNSCQSAEITICPNSTTYIAIMRARLEWDEQTFTCGSTFYGLESNKVNITVSVPVTSIVINPSSFTIDEGRQQLITCQTSYCKPQATVTWYMDGVNITSNSTTSTMRKGTLIQSTSYLTYTGKRSDTKIYCTAKNVQDSVPITSQTVQINVQFAPLASPAIKVYPPLPQYNNGTSVTLTCELPGGNPLASLTWQCMGQQMSGSNQNTTGVARSSIILTMNSSYNGQQCFCRARHHMFSYERRDKFTFLVLFPPSASPVITANPSSLPYEDETLVNLTCKVSGGNPLAFLKWQCKGQEVIGSNQTTTDVARSTITLSLNSSYNNQQCICTASHHLYSNNRTVQFTFSVLYAPTNIPVIAVVPTATDYYEGTNVTLVCQLSGGNPIAALTWECKGRNVAGSYQNVIGTANSNISFTVDSTYNNETCVCTANHTLLQIPTSTYFVFSVLYNNHITSVKYLEGSGTVKENDSVSLQCDVDGNPLSTIQWEKYDNGSLLHRDTGVSRSVFTIPLTSCIDTGKYKVTANNGIGPTAENITTIYVRCSPRMDERFQDQSPSKIKLSTNNSLYIAVGILSYPTPAEMNVTWTFMSKDSSENKTISNGVDNYQVSKYLKSNEQRTNLTKVDLTSSDFGTYMLTIRNQEGMFTSHYEVISTRPPSVPSNFTLNCNNPGVAEMSWISEFNGGDKQKFVLQYKSDQYARFTDYGIGVDDIGLKVSHTETVEEIQGEYWFRIKSLNKFGETYSMVLSCYIKEKCKPRDSGPLNLGIMFGILFGIFFVVSIVLSVILFIKTRKSEVQERKEQGKTYAELHVMKQEQKYEDIRTPAKKENKEREIYTELRNPEDKDKSAVYVNEVKKIGQTKSSTEIYVNTSLQI